MANSLNWAYDILETYAPYYSTSPEPLTTNLGLNLAGMDPVVAANFVLIDNGGSGGTTVEVNGSTVNNPNFNGTTPAAPTGSPNVTWQVSGSSVSAYANLSAVPSLDLGDGDSNSITFNGANGISITGVTGASINLDNSSFESVGVYITDDTESSYIDVNHGSISLTATTGTISLNGQNSPNHGQFTLGSGGLDFNLASAVGSALVTGNNNTLTLGGNITFTGKVSANTMLAGPTAGPSTGAPSFRTLVVADLPTSGTWAFAGTISGNLTFSGSCLSTNTETFGLSSYTSGIDNSPSLVFAGSYESASTPTYAEDSWTIQNVIGSGVNGTSTLTISHSGTSGAASVGITNTTAATASTTNATPYLGFNANYWTGSASALDSWTIQSVLTAGTNGTSSLTFSHSGTSGTAAIVIPQGGGLGIPSLVFSGTTCGIGCYGSLININTPTVNTGILFTQGTSSNYGYFRMYNTGVGTYLSSGNFGPNLAISGSLSNTANGVAVTLTNGIAGIGGPYAPTSGTTTAVLIGPVAGGSSAEGYCTFAPTSGSANFVALQVAPTIDQTSSASGNYTAILANVTETAVLGTETTNRLLSLQVGSTERFGIDPQGHVSGNGNLAGQVTGAASGTPTSVSVSYTNSFAATPTVVVTPLTSGVGAFYISASSSSGFTITWTTGTNSAVWNWIAIG